MQTQKAKKKNKTKIWVDVLTPKQALFTKAMIERAPPNVELVLTTRNYDELNKFLDQLKLETISSFGKHGGPRLEDKLVAGVQRMSELTSFVLKNNFDCSLSFISPEAARVSFGLGLRHYICSDSPHANASSRLSVPLATKLFTPFPVPKEKWTQYGLKASQVASYHALDPWAWLLPRRKKELSQKRKGGSQNTVLIRLDETYASYMKQGSGISSIVEELVEKIKAIGSSSSFEIVIIPRYDEQRSWAKEKFANSCTVPESTIDGTELISKASLLIGGGGTMTQEAALLGVPNISYFPSTKLDVFENYYFPKKLSAKASTPPELIRETSKLLGNIEEAKTQFAKRAQDAVKSFEDPVKFIFREILKD